MATKTSKSTSGKKKAVPGREKMAEAYMKHVLLEGAPPASEYKFAMDLGITEAEFYTRFTSFEAIEAFIWDNALKKSLDRLEKDSAYAEYSVREKLLAFYYTHIEDLTEMRSFVRQSWKRWNNPFDMPPALKDYKKRFLDFVRLLINSGLQTGEIKERPVMTERYEKGFWVQLVYLINFWMKDSSPEFQKTDAAIEKAVNLSMDLLGQSSLDSLVDFAKFAFQNR